MLTLIQITLVMATLCLVCAATLFTWEIFLGGEFLPHFYGIIACLSPILLVLLAINGWIDLYYFSVALLVLCGGICAYTEDDTLILVIAILGVSILARNTLSIINNIAKQDAQEVITKGVITCYSSGVLTYKGTTQGTPTRDSYGTWNFTDAATSKKLKASGDCVVSN